MRYAFWKDAKFWTSVVDVVTYLLLYFVGKYSTASVVADVKTVWLAVQPIVVIIIAGWFQADSVALRLGDDVKHIVEK